MSRVGSASIHPRGVQLTDKLAVGDLDDIEARIATTLTDAVEASTRYALDGPIPSETGVYAIRYAGRHPIYRAAADHDLVLYAGRASDLRDRMGKHRRKIDQAERFDLADFTVTAFSCSPGMSLLAEWAIIRHYRPVWNLIVPGFGSNRQGSSRTGQRRSAWATLHPGYATEVGAADQTPEHIAVQVVQHLDEQCPRVSTVSM